jgi:hypothetical protein
VRVRNLDIGTTDDFVQGPNGRVNTAATISPAPTSERTLDVRQKDAIRASVMLLWLLCRAAATDVVTAKKRSAAADGLLDEAVLTKRRTPSAIPSAKSTAKVARGGGAAVTPVVSAAAPAPPERTPDDDTDPFKTLLDAIRVLERRCIQRASAATTVREQCEAIARRGR